MQKIDITSHHLQGCWDGSELRVANENTSWSSRQVEKFFSQVKLESILNFLALLKANSFTTCLTQLDWSSLQETKSLNLSFSIFYKTDPWLPKPGSKPNWLIKGTSATCLPLSWVYPPLGGTPRGLALQVYNCALLDLRDHHFFPSLLPLPTLAIRLFQGMHVCHGCSR